MSICQIDLNQKKEELKIRSVFSIILFFIIFLPFSYASYHLYEEQNLEEQFFLFYFISLCILFGFIIIWFVEKKIGPLVKTTIPAIVIALLGRDLIKHYLSIELYNNLGYILVLTLLNILIFMYIYLLYDYLKLYYQIKCKPNKKSKREVSNSKMGWKKMETTRKNTFSTELDA